MQPICAKSSRPFGSLPAEASGGRAVRHDEAPAQQMALFPETNPLIAELEHIDLPVFPEIPERRREGNIAAIEEAVSQQQQ